MTTISSKSNMLLLGGTCELALVTAGMMIKAGHHPVLTYRNPKGLQKIMTCLAAYKDKFMTCECDLSRRDTIHALFGRIEGRFDSFVDFSHGRMESLIASADSNAVYTYFTENISARAEVIKLASRAMLKQKKGRMIFVSSSAAENPNPGQGFYAASKLAAEALYRNISLELEGRGITCVTLRPGYINSGRGRQYIEENKNKYTDKIHKYGILSCEQVAEAILYLLSDKGREYNAMTIEMDGIHGLRSTHGHIIEY